jgi:CubicO group peptidase (beta-lactamase class C family)
MTIVKRIFKWLGYALLALIAAGLIGYLANKTYMDRYFKLAGAQLRGQSQQAEWYDPVDKVPGATGAPLPMAAPTEMTVDPAAIATASAYAKSKDSYGLLVWQGGKLQAADYYQGFDRNRLIASKSMAKMIVGLVIGRAIAQGHIRSVDQPMSDFITEWKGTPKAKSTIRHFLQNSSGISRFNYSNSWPWSQTSREYLSEYHDELLINETEYQYEPGTEYDYSMITSDMLAIVVERATKQRYAAYVGKNLIQPIGAQGGTVYINRPGGLAHSGCCMMLPAESFIRMGILMAQDGVWDGNRLLPEGWVRETITPSPANPKWGLHMWIGQPYQQRVRFFPKRSQPIGVLHSEPYAADDIFLWDGSGNQAMWISPSKNLVVLRFGNTPKPRYGQKGEWDNSLIPNTIIRAILPGAPEGKPIPAAPASAGA